VTARVPAAFILFAAAVLFTQAWPLERWSLQGPGEGFFPLVLSAALAVLALVQIVTAGPRTRPEHAAADADGDAPRDRVAFAIYVGATLAFALVFTRLGMLLSVLLFMIVTVRFAERRAWGPAVLSGVVADLALYVVFGRLLGVPLPQGVIENALRAGGLLR
jgi:hypothetical protein